MLSNFILLLLSEMGVFRPLLRCLLKAMDVVSVVFVASAFDLPQSLGRLMEAPVSKVYELVTFYGYGFITCPIWLCGRLVIFVYRCRKSSKQLSKKVKQTNEVSTSISAKLCGLETPFENVKVVVGLNMRQLRQKIVKKGDISSLDVVEGFQVHALALMDSKTGSVAEMVFDADVTAIIADQNLKTSNLSPIHGIPIVVSNNFAVKGEDCNGSLVFKSSKPVGFDSALVSMLKRVGAIPYLLANQAPIWGSLTGSSRLYGTCKHPTHRDRTIGGSCSGLAALLFQNAAVLGFGVDVLGDVRIPAAYCGATAFRPTSHHLSQQGVLFPLFPPAGLHPSVSLIAMSVDSISDALTSLCTADIAEYDLNLPRITFKPKTIEGKLTIGLYTSLSGLAPAVPAVERMMGEVKSALEKMGHIVVEFKPSKLEELLLLLISEMARNEEYWNLFVRENYANTLTYGEVLKFGLPKVPFLLRPLVGFFLRLQQGASCKQMKSILKTWRNPMPAGKIVKKLETYQREFFEQWKDEKLDLLIGPATPSPALLATSSTSLNLFSAIGYTLLPSILDCPAGVLPFGKITKADVDSVIPDSSSSIFGELARQQAGSEGLPIAIQIISKPWDDGLALALMAKLEEAHV